MPKTAWKSYLLGVLALVFASVGFAYLYFDLNEVSDRLALSEEKLRQVEKTAAKLPAPVTAPAADRKDLASAMDLDVLRAELTELKKMVASLAAAKPALATAVGAEGDAVKGGGTPEVSAEKLAAIKKVVEDTLDERDKKQRSGWAGMADDWLKTRRKQSLDELETRLKLSAFQKEQISAVLEEQGKVASEFMTTMFSGGGGGGGNREESRKKIAELTTGTDTKVKQLLTAQQSVEFDTWKQETGGFGGMGGMGGGGRGMRGPGGGGQGSGGTTSGGGEQPK